MPRSKTPSDVAAQFFADNLVLNPLDLGPHPLFLHRTKLMQQETRYKDYRIVAVKYDGEGLDSFGFKVETVYAVLDDFDDPALPLVPRYFWSPADAAGAIDFYLWAKKIFPQKKWATSPAHEYNMMTLMRRRMPEVFETFHDLRGILQESYEFGDNPHKAITDRLNRMGSEVMSWKRAVEPPVDDGF